MRGPSEVNKPIGETPLGEMNETMLQPTKNEIINKITGNTGLQNALYSIHRYATGSEDYQLAVGTSVVKSMEIETMISNYFIKNPEDSLCMTMKTAARNIYEKDFNPHTSHNLPDALNNLDILLNGLDVFPETPPTSPF